MQLLQEHHSSTSESIFYEITKQLPNELLYIIFETVIISNLTETSQLLEFFKMDSEVLLRYVLKPMLTKAEFVFHLHCNPPMHAGVFLKLYISFQKNRFLIDLDNERPQIDDYYNSNSIIKQKALIFLSTSEADYRENFKAQIEKIDRLNAVRNYCEPELSKSFHNIELKINFTLYNINSRQTSRSHFNALFRCLFGGATNSKTSVGGKVSELIVQSDPYYSYDINKWFPNLKVLTVLINSSSGSHGYSSAGPYHVFHSLQYIKDWLSNSSSSRQVDEKKIVFEFQGGVVVSEAFLSFLELYPLQNPLHLEINIVTKLDTANYGRLIGFGESIHEHCFRSALSRFKSSFKALTYATPYENQQSITTLNSAKNLTYLSINSDFRRQDFVITYENPLVTDDKYNYPSYPSPGPKFPELPKPYILQLSFYDMPKLRYLDISHSIFPAELLNQLPDHLLFLRLNDCITQPNYIKLPEQLVVFEVSITREFCELPIIINTNELKSLSQVDMCFDFLLKKDGLRLPSIDNVQYFILSLPSTLYKLSFSIGKFTHKYDSFHPSFCFKLEDISFNYLIDLVELKIEIFKIYTCCCLDRFPRKLERLNLNIIPFELERGVSITKLY